MKMSEGGLAAFVLMSMLILFISGCMDEGFSFRGFLFRGEDLFLGYGRVQVFVRPTTVESEELSDVIEYTPPYTLTIIFTTLFRSDEYQNSEISLEQVRGVRLLSSEGELLYQNAGGAAYTQNNRDYGWQTTRYRTGTREIDVPPQDFLVEFVLVIKIDGQQLEVPAQINIAAIYEEDRPTP